MKLSKNTPTPPLVAISAIILCACSAFAKTTSWVATANGGWDVAANWDNGVPEAGDEVVIGNKALTVTVTNATPRLAKLTVGNGSYVTVLSATGWETCIAADEVVVKSRAQITCSTYCTNESSNRVWIAADTLTVDGTIAVNTKGYYGNFNGPAWAGITGADYRHAGSYGGKGESDYWDGVAKFSKTYGSAEWPYDPGCGKGPASNNPRAGGGAIFLDVTGALIVNGTVTASASGNLGSGGGIVIKCNTISGSGSVKANAAEYNSASGAGGGGRLAVHYNATAQAVVDDCLVRFEALGGLYKFVEPATTLSGCGSSQYHRERYSGDGTIWFPDWQMVTNAVRVANGVRLGGVFTTSAAPLERIVWPAGTVLEKCKLKLDGVAIEVPGDLTVKSTGGAGNMGAFTTGLIVTGNRGISVAGNLTLENSGLDFTGGSLSVGGDLTLTNSVNVSQKRAGGALIVRAANTGSTFGATVAVGGTWTVNAATFVRPYADAQQTGAIPGFTARDFVLKPNGLIDARETGYASTCLTTSAGDACRGYGPAAGMQSSSSGTGASHGGLGGYAGASYQYHATRKTYGDENHPVTPGSSGSIWNGPYKYFPGGGAFHLLAARSATVDGTIDADANYLYYATHYSAGSGGSVYIKAKNLSGDGAIRARGGWSDVQKTGGTWGIAAPGGGGRIALVATTYADGAALTNNLSVVPGAVQGSGGANTGDAEPGTCRLLFGSVLTVSESPVELGVVSPGLGDTAGFVNTPVDFALTGGVADGGTACYYTAAGDMRGEFGAALVVTDGGAATNVVRETAFTQAISEDTSVVWTFTNVHSKVVASALAGGRLNVDGADTAKIERWVGFEDAVTLTAVPDAGRFFYCWEGDTNDLDVTNATISVGGSTPRTLYAKFWDGAHIPVTATWVGGSSTYWDDAANWDVGATPGFADNVVISSSATLTVNLTNATPILGVVTLGNSSPDASLRTTLAMSGWETQLRAEIVEIGDGADVKPATYCTDTASNRVWISCMTMTIASGGSVNADSRGYYTKANGPAWTPGQERHNAYSGAYGGRGGTTYWDTNLEGSHPAPHTYGSAEWPLDPGCGAHDTTKRCSGGGAVRIDATDEVAVNGVITANGSEQCSGGSVLVVCRRIVGSGTVRANGGTNSGGGSAGSGGRIAVHYDTAEQGAVDCRVRFSALGGVFEVSEPNTNMTSYSSTSGSFRYQRDAYAEPGTLWFTDWRFVTGEARAKAGVLLGGVVTTGVGNPNRLVFPAGTVMETCHLVLSNCNVEVAGDLTVKATGTTDSLSGYKTGLVLGWGCSTHVAGDVLLENSKLEVAGGELTVDGNLTQTNSALSATRKRAGGALIVRAAETNGVDQPFGAFVTIGGTWTVGTNTFVKPYAEPHGGAIPALRRASSF